MAGELLQASEFTEFFVITKYLSSTQSEQGMLEGVASSKSNQTLLLAF
jgi:hypothetical protein